MLRNITAVIFAVITLVAFLAIYPTIITSVHAVLATAGLTDTFPAVASIITLVPLVAVIKKLPSLMETLSRKILKFGETLTSNVDGNPELSPKWSEKCTDLTGIKSERHLKEKVGAIVKTMDNLNWWGFNRRIDSLRCS